MTMLSKLSAILCFGRNLKAEMNIRYDTNMRFFLSSSQIPLDFKKNPKQIKILFFIKMTDSYFKLIFTEES